MTSPPASLYNQGAVSPLEGMERDCTARWRRGQAGTPAKGRRRMEEGPRAAVAGAGEDAMLVTQSKKETECSSCRSR